MMICWMENTIQEQNSYKYFCLPSWPNNILFLVFQVISPPPVAHSFEL